MLSFLVALLGYALLGRISWDQTSGSPAALLAALVKLPAKMFQRLPAKSFAIDLAAPAVASDVEDFSGETPPAENAPVQVADAAPPVEEGRLLRQPVYRPYAEDLQPQTVARLPVEVAPVSDFDGQEAEMLALQQRLRELGGSNYRMETDSQLGAYHFYCEFRDHLHQHPPVQFEATDNDQLGVMRQVVAEAEQWHRRQRR